MMGEALIGSVLDTLLVSEVVESQSMVYVTANDSVALAAEKLTETGVSSLPIFSEPNKFDVCLGVIDFSDIAALLLRLKTQGYDELKPKKNIWTAFEGTTVQKAVPAGQSDLVQLSVKATLREAVSKCAQYGLRRMLAVDEDGQICAILSPSEMMKHIMFALDGKEDSTLRKSVKELDIGYEPVICVRKRDSLFSAFKKMTEDGKSAVAITGDSNNSLQGSLSMSDIKFIIREKHSKHLNSNCWKYLTHIKEQEVDAIFPYFGVTEDAKLEVVMSKLLATGVHHLYVVDKAGNPLKVISFADICEGMMTGVPSK